MASKLLFSSASALPTVDTVNEAGGKAYRFSPRHALAQYAVTGCLNSTFYATATTQLDQTLKLAASVDTEFVAKTAIYCRTHGYMKDMPALLCATLAARDCALLERIFDRVIDNGKMLRNFVQIVRSGVAGRKSLGTAPRRLVRRWLERRSDAEIFRASVGQSPSMADIIKMTHPRPANPAREALYGWMINRGQQSEALPEVVRQFEAFKKGESAEAPDVPFQMLTALELDANAWRQIARRAPWQTTRMNLNTFARHGVFADSELTERISARLRDPAEVQRARCFPYQLLTAYQSADAAIPAPVREALQDAMEAALKNVPLIEGRIYVCPDVSGSMQSPATGYRPGATTATRCIDVAALVAAAFLRRNASAEVIAFSDNVVPCVLNPRDSVMTNAKKLASLPSGGTDCSAPLRQLDAERKAGDLVILVSDNMSWMSQARGGKSTATMVEWEKFRKRNPKARLVCLDIQPCASTQAVEREEILNIGGFSDSVFELIAAFASGAMHPDHWMRKIEEIVL